MRLLDLTSFFTLMKNQWRSPQEIRDIQDLKLRRLVKHAYAHVPYYRRLFDTVGLRPSDIAGVKDLHRIPTTSREQLMEGPRDQFVAKGIDLGRCRSTRTSGCTRKPLRIFHRREDLTLTNLGWVRTYLANGLKPWNRIAEFGGNRSGKRSKSWYEFFGLLPRRTLANSDKPSVWISDLRRWKPDALIGYSSTLKLLAREVDGRGISNIRPKLVFSTSELLDNDTRRFLRSTFRAKIVDVYGSEEGRCIAWECEQCAGYHINADLVIVEFLRGGNPVPYGEDGEIVITNLHSFAMPFIRYKQADVGAPVKRTSVCGRGFPLMSLVKGRLDDFVILENGRKISPQSFYYAVAPVAGIVEWRAVQEKIGELRLEVVIARGPKQSRRKRKIRQRLSDNLKTALGNDLKLTVEIVSSITRMRGEKFRSVISLVADERS